MREATINKVYEYGGEFGSFEINLEEKTVNDAIQWMMVAEKSDFESEKFLHTIRKILNHMFEDGTVEFTFKNQDIIDYEIKRFLDPDYRAGRLGIELIYNHKDNYVLQLDFRNDSHLE